MPSEQDRDRWAGEDLAKRLGSDPTPTMEDMFDTSNTAYGKAAIVTSGIVSDWALVSKARDRASFPTRKGSTPR